MLNIMLIYLDSKVSCPIIMRERGHMIPDIFIYKHGRGAVFFV
jgi:hypothetical protein